MNHLWVSLNNSSHIVYTLTDTSNIDKLFRSVVYVTYEYMFNQYMVYKLCAYRWAKCIPEKWIFLGVVFCPLHQTDFIVVHICTIQNQPHINHLDKNKFTNFFFQQPAMCWMLWLMPESKTPIISIGCHRCVTIGNTTMSVRYILHIFDKRTAIDIIILIEVCSICIFVALYGYLINLARWNTMNTRKNGYYIGVHAVVGRSLWHGVFGECVTINSNTTDRSMLSVWAVSDYSSWALFHLYPVLSLSTTSRGLTYTPESIFFLPSPNPFSFVSAIFLFTIRSFSLHSILWMENDNNVN